MLPLLACAASFLLEASGPLVEARGEEGFHPVCALANGLVVVPLHSRSEVVARAARHADGWSLRWGGGGGARRPPPRLRVLEHASDERVVLAQDGAPRLVSGARCAWRVARDGGDESPWLLRQDREALAGTLLVELRDVRAGESLVLVPAQGAGEAPLTVVARPEGVAGPLGATVRSRSTDAIVLPLAPAERTTITLEVGGVGLDQLQVARVAPIDLAASPAREPSAVRQVSLTNAGRAAVHGAGFDWPAPRAAGGSEAVPRDPRAEIELGGDAGFHCSWEAGAEPPEGRVRTLLVDVRARGGELDAAKREPRPAAAPTGALFVDATARSGVRMLHAEGEDLQLDIRPTMGPGAAWGDVDGDGWLDLHLPQGEGRAGLAPQSARFFRNLGDGRFVDETEARGLALVGAGMGALFADLDGDGDLDLVALERGRARLMIAHEGRFHDRSAALGLPDGRWYTAAAAGDVDRDGDLDLYVTSYLRYDESAMPPLEEDRYQREDPVAMLPYAFPGEAKSLLLNEPAPAVDAANGGALFARRFRDVAPEAKLEDPAGRGMQALFWDFDRDGDLDLSLANDVSPNRFWRNEGGGAFKDVGFSSGLDDPRGSMGLAAGDIDGDGDEDLFVSNWQLESNALYVNNLVSHNSSRSRVATFRDKAVEAGFARPSVGLTGWGVELLDFDNDGDLDAALANGYTGPDYEGTGICMGQPSHYYENDGEGRFTLSTVLGGEAFARPLASRAMCAADHDRDGDLDLVVTANNGVARLLENRSPRGNAWLVLRLRGADLNTHAIGAEVEIEAGGKRLRRSLRAGTGYLSGNPPELHFGLGAARKVEACIVRWPSGRESRHDIETIDAIATIEEPR
jgi:hypothetical protein